MTHPADIEFERIAAELRRKLRAAGATDGTLPNGEKIARFVRVNGVWWVMEAAKRTCDRLRAASDGRAEPVVDAWAYLVAVVNGRPARSAHLFRLLNLWESSLRARVDLEYTVTWGNAWYVDPWRYLSQGHAPALVRSQLALFASNPDAPDQSLVNTKKFPDARKFLRELYLGGLHNILLDKWDTKFRARMPHPTRGEIMATQLDRWLRDAFDARQQVMHADRIDMPLFEQSKNALLNLLELLGFDVEKALTAIASRNPHEDDSALRE